MMSLSMENISNWVSEVGALCGYAFGFRLEYAKILSYMM